MKDATKSIVDFDDATLENFFTGYEHELELENWISAFLLKKGVTVPDNLVYNFNRVPFSEELQKPPMIMEARLQTDEGTIKEEVSFEERTFIFSGEKCIGEAQQEKSFIDCTSDDDPDNVPGETVAEALDRFRLSVNFGIMKVCLKGLGCIDISIYESALRQIGCPPAPNVR